MLARHTGRGEPAHDLSGGSPGGHDWNLLDAGMAGRQRDGPSPPFLDSGEPDGDRIPRRYGDTARIRLQHAQRSSTLSVGLQPAGRAVRVAHSRALHQPGHSAAGRALFGGLVLPVVSSARPNFDAFGVAVARREQYWPWAT